jgi:hypothetical protein
MSDGGTGEGISYWANIRISGNLDAKDLQDVIADIKKLLGGSKHGKAITGAIMSEVRASTKSTATFNVSAQPAKK